MFNQARNFKIDGGTFVSVSGRNGIDRLFDYTTPDAAHDSYVAESKASCLKGTRTQYIEDITAWTSSMNQIRKERMLWMYGPAGVGKSAVAKSCAETIAAHGMLGASFFFSRDNRVDDPSRFFTTIAHQIATTSIDYKSVLGTKVESNPNLLTKGLEVQFRELIIKPFLELESRNVPVSQRAVIIDGLDECNGDSPQTRIVELVGKSIAEYGSRVPLLWAFFSRPERHIDKVFSTLSKSPLFWQVELPVSRDYDSDIRLYLRHTLQLPSPSSDVIRSSSVGLETAWPSDKDLDTLVQMVAGLFIYTATVARFIMDPDALSPQRQLNDVLSFYSQLQLHSIHSGNQSTVTAELDAFYSMIMGRLPLIHLPAIQQILLTCHDFAQEKKRSSYQDTIYANSPIRFPAIHLGLTLQELENLLSRLRSVLRFKPLEKKSSFDRDPPWWPGSTRVFFYHASFMEFLLDQNRSKGYWIRDKHHYSALVVRGLQLWNDMYMLDGLPRDDKIQKIRELISVFPDESFTSTECLRFCDDLMNEYLGYGIFRWCGHSGRESGVLEQLRNADMTNIWRRKLRTNYVFETEGLPEDILADLRSNNAKRWKCLRSPGYAMPSLPKVAYPRSTAPVKQICAYMASVLFTSDAVYETELSDCGKLIHEVCKDPGRSDYIYSQITHYFSERIKVLVQAVKKLNTETMDDLHLMDYYSYEWHEYEHTHKFTRADQAITRAALSP